MKKQLDWKNLKDEYCPSCYSEIFLGEGIWRCSKESCKFTITSKRYDELLEDIEKEEAGDDAENA